MLTLFAWALIKATRRFFPGGARYTVRQGVANLYRPQNQTVAITLALGFGVFLIASISLLQAALRDQLSFDAGTEQPNMVLFDLQPEQVRGVMDLVERESTVEPIVVPMVSAEIAAINGTPVATLLADTSDARRSRWALRRTYRNTYRDSLKDTEQLLEGEWFQDPDPMPEVSIEDDVAENLQVGIGDRITWDVQGRMIETRITSRRSVDWARFEPNFYMVFEPGVLEEAPHTVLAFARVADPERRALLQRDVVLAFPNVSILDVARVQEALDAILGQVNRAIRFLGSFAVIGGLLVLVGALATSRYQRMRESALLKTLGARRRQILQILFTEYLSLGVLSGLAGLLLGIAGAWGLVRFVFEGTFSPSVPPLLLLWVGVVGLTVAVGLAGSRSVLRRTPLSALRDGAD